MFSCSGCSPLVVLYAPPPPMSAMPPLPLQLSIRPSKPTSPRPPVEMADILDVSEKATAEHGRDRCLSPVGEGRRLPPPTLLPASVFWGCLVVRN